MNDNWYLYINKESLQVTGISASLDPETLDYVETIEKDLAIEFVNGPHLINDYIVYFDGTKPHFVKKEKSKDFVAPFYYSPLMMDKEVENADITVHLINDEMRVSLRKELSGYAMTIYGNVSEQKRNVEFYISAKNDPNKLYEVVYVDMMSLIAGSEVLIAFNYDPDKVSIFTRKIFDTYSLVK
jgi:hypothetical protein